MGNTRWDIISYQRKGADVIVKIRRTIVDVGIPPNTEYPELLLEGQANASDEEIERLVMSKIMELEH